jgi:hypothetical protein
MKLFFLILILNLNCNNFIEQKFNEQKYKNVLSLLTEIDLCVENNIDKTDCIDLANKVIYLDSNIDTIDLNYLYYSTQDKEFIPLLKYFDGNHSNGIYLSEFDNSIGKGEFDNLIITSKKEDSNLTISVSKIYFIKGFNYCVVNIRESDYKQWYIKIKFDSSKIIATEIWLLLD